MDDSGREVLELHGCLVAIEEIHAACGGWGGAGLHLTSLTSSPDATQTQVSPKPHTHTAPLRTHPSSAGTPTSLQSATVGSQKGPHCSCTRTWVGAAGSSGCQGRLSRPCSVLPTCPHSLPDPFHDSLIQQLIGFRDRRSDVLRTWATGGENSEMRGGWGLEKTRPRGGSL